MFPNPLLDFEDVFVAPDDRGNVVAVGKSVELLSIYNKHKYNNFLRNLKNPTKTRQYPVFAGTQKS